MSYILDALKKSDQQRQRGTTPTLQSSPSIPVSAEPQRPWLYPLLALALAGIAFAVGSVAPWRKAQDVAAPAVVAPAPAAVAPAPAVAAPAVAAPAPAIIPPAAVVVATPSPAPAPAIAPAPATVARVPDTIPAQQPQAAPPPTIEKAAPRVAAAERPSAPTPAVQQPQVVAPVQARTEPARASQRASETQAPVRDAKAEDRVQTIAELPASLRAELPSMTVTVHAYSATPKDRLVGVNDKLLREGDSLAPDLMLERITPDGMIFTYKGTRFQRGLR